MFKSSTNMIPNKTYKILHTSPLHKTKAEEPISINYFFFNLKLTFLLNVCSEKAVQKQPPLVSRKPKASKPVIIKAPPSEIEGKLGKIARIDAQIQAYPPPRYSWYINSMRISPGPRYKVCLISH